MIQRYIDHIKTIIPGVEVNLSYADLETATFNIDGYDVTESIANVNDINTNRTTEMWKFLGFYKNLQKAKSHHGDRFFVYYGSYTRLRDKVLIYDIGTGKSYQIIFSNFVKGGIPAEIAQEDKRAKNASEFITKANEVHNSFYTYDKVEYAGAANKVIITCPIHGNFLQTAHDHVQGSGCPRCKADKRRVSFKEFLERSNLKHGSKYEYIAESWNGIDKDVRVICKNHGEFVVNARLHTEGSECPVCRKTIDAETYTLNNITYTCIDNVYPYKFNCSKHGNYVNSYIRYRLNKYHGCPKCTEDKATVSFEDYVIIANGVHNNKYEYIEASYINKNKKIRIVCPHHGEFEQTGKNHLAGQGCPECAKENVANQKRLTHDEFISIVEDKFPELDFSESVYTGSENDLTVRCKEHGNFTRKAKVFVQGLGCPKCKMNRQEKELYEFITSNSDFEIVYNYRNKEIGSFEIDLFIPELRLGIEYNGIAFHHSTPYSPFEFYNGTKKAPEYHYTKWKKCADAGITLISTPDFYWMDEHKRNIIKSKIMHHMQLDDRIFARKCIFREISNKEAYAFYDENHIEGRGHPYKDAKSYGLFYNDEMVMCSTIGYIYNQTRKDHRLKVSRICTSLNLTVVGGLTKLIKYLKNIFGDFQYHSTLEFGGTSVLNLDYEYLGPRYFWVNPRTLEYYHRNSCQKHLLEKNFGEKLLSDDTESSYMSRLGFLKYFDSGIVSIKF